MPFPIPRPRKADFPRVEDVTGAPEVDEIDAYDAARALSVLWRLCCADLAKVYHPHMDHVTWMIWLEITQRRVELVAWVAEWLASQEEMDGPDGGDAA